ncbi:hypothetical protein PHET_10734 [Paragonimus heterotremus]|uniref:Uncharacterized protein n=1 Tax=Paragonimus heterotremus TaxID=100268 RepID=A0A8J4SJR5_9TREM|nr:hypothetical protein PHET_10734 [Paragonimus heterotremus]
MPWLIQGACSFTHCNHIRNSSEKYTPARQVGNFSANRKAQWKIPSYLLVLAGRLSDSEHLRCVLDNENRASRSIFMTSEQRIMNQRCPEVMGMGATCRSCSGKHKLFVIVVTDACGLRLTLVGRNCRSASNGWQTGRPRPSSSSSPFSSKISGL